MSVQNRWTKAVTAFFAQNQANWTTDGVRAL